MQDKALIPTVLVEGPRRPVPIVEAIPPGPFRVLRIVRFVLFVAWHWWRTRLTGRAGVGEPARRARIFLERMGGIWVKAGQIVAMRRDVFHPDTCDELARLQDHAEGFAWPLVRGIVEEDLGAPLEEIFSEFSERPIAAASIGQTHEARLRHNGVRVAVKVQRPFVAENFAYDLRYVGFVFRWLGRLGVAPHARWGDMLWELTHALEEELDYRKEGSTIARMRKNLRKQKVYAPKVFSRFQSRRVLVMEFVEGTNMSDYIKVATEDPARLVRWLEENEIDPHKVSERLVLGHLRQMFEDNFYHSDLHPGNILLQRNSRLVLIDFGTVGSFDKSLLQKYRMLFSALAARDYQKVADLFLLLCPPLPNGDVPELKAKITRALKTWEARARIARLPYHEKSATQLFATFAQILGEHRVPSNWEFLRLTRCDLTLDASLMFLSPDIDYLGLYRRYERRATARLRRRAMRPEALRATVGSLVAAGHLPALFAENLHFKAEWVRSRALSFEGRISKLAYLGRGALSLLAWGMALASMLFLARFLRDHHVRSLLFLEGRWPAGVLSALPAYRPEAWIAVALGAFYLFRKVIKLRRHVDEKDYERPGH